MVLTLFTAAGKDRTGVLAALILDLVGVPAEIIALEYALTRIGVEPFKEVLLPGALRSFGLGEGQGLAEAANTPGAKELLTINEGIMLDFYAYLKEKYGGAEGYLLTRLGFDESGISKIRARLSSKARTT